MVFFYLELAQISDEQAAKLFAAPDAAAYRHTIEEARKYRPHQLSEPEERVLTDFSPVGNPSWVRLFEELCARIRVNVDGSDLALDQALTLLREPDRNVRREASGAVTQALRGDVRTRGYIFNVILQEKAIDDRLRHFPTWISSRNLANETSDEAVQALVEAVTGRYDVCIRYYRVKKRLLDVGDLHEWDRYAPVGEVARSLTWDESKALVLDSYRRFSPRAGGARTPSRPSSGRLPSTDTRLPATLSGAIRASSPSSSSATPSRTSCRRCSATRSSSRMSTRFGGATWATSCTRRATCTPTLSATSWRCPYTTATSKSVPALSTSTWTSWPPAARRAPTSWFASWGWTSRTRASGMPV